MIIGILLVFLVFLFTLAQLRSCKDVREVGLTSFKYEILRWNFTAAINLFNK